MGTTTIPVFIMAKVGYMLSALMASIVLHHTLLSKENTFLRNKNQFTTAISSKDIVQTAKMKSNIRPNDPDRSDDGASNGNPSLNYTAEALADQITDLPGLTFTPSFAQFSGYLEVSPTRSIHYWYIESLNNPTTDPVVLWTNGGPGCSGLLGLGTEFGPFIFEAGGQLSQNPFTWNNLANILYVEQPAGVGFSKFSDPEDENVGDERSALDNYQLIKNFFERFPERKNNEFYIASESYGGHYIPHLAKTILDKNTDNSINFRGFLVGNPYVDPFSNDVTMIQTYYMHGLIALPLFAKWEDKCLDPDTYDDSCDVLFDAMMDQAGKGINPYALDYPVCTEPDNNDYPPQEDEDEDGHKRGDERGDEHEDKAATTTATAVLMEEGLVSGVSTSSNHRRMMSSSQSARLIDTFSVRSLLVPFLPKGDVYHPCAEDHLFTYLNRKDVQEALHVETDVEWSMCTDDINYSKEDSITPQMYLYEELIAYGKQSGSNLKMMVFSGDDDSVCSTASTQYWIWKIGADPIPDRTWLPWKFENQTAGYLTEFDLGGGGNDNSNSNSNSSSFIFATVHGAGHEVPAYRPAEAFALFKSFFNGEWDTSK
jgi:carboxypeptidase C (cathepsin A)